MKTAVRSLTQAGVAAFESYLRSGTPLGPIPSHLLSDAQFSEAIDVVATADPDLTFASKLDFGQHLAQQLSGIMNRPGMRRSTGLWTWLALLYFDRICPEGDDGQRRPGEEYRYVLSRDYRHHYRHLVRTPCLAAHIHGQNARLVLSGDLDTHGEASEALLSREQIFSNNALFAALDRLYVSSKGAGWSIRKGARGKGGGTLRRLGKIIKQFDLTYDLRAMSVDKLLGILPTEFDRWKV